MHALDPNLARARQNAVFQVPEPNKFEAEFYRQASKKNLDAGGGSGGGMGSVCSNSISSLGLSSHGSLNLSPLPNILQVCSEPSK